MIGPHPPFLSIQKVTKVKDTDDKVLKKVLVDGEGYEKPNEGATVVLADIEGKLEDGAPGCSRVLRSGCDGGPAEWLRQLSASAKRQRCTAATP